MFIAFSAHLLQHGVCLNGFFDCVSETIQLFFLFQVYDGKGTLEEGETAEARFIKIQAAYELLMDEEKRKQYDKDNRVNPMKVRSLLNLYEFTLEFRSLNLYYTDVYEMYVVEFLQL